MCKVASVASSRLGLFFFRYLKATTSVEVSLIVEPMTDPRYYLDSQSLF